MKTNKLMKIGSMLLVLLMVAFCLTACGKTVTITVNDMGTKTEIEAKTDATIADILKEAGITLGEKDETEPAADAVLGEETTEIKVKRYAKVTVVKDGEEKTVEVVGATVEEAIKAAGVTLADNESADVELSSYAKDGMKITVAKAVKVSVTADGKTEEVTTKAANVEAVLAELKITLGADDEVSEKLDTKLSDGMSIVVKRVEYKEEVKKETIDYSTKEEYDSSMSQGTSKVKQEGVEGEKEVTYKVKYVDGKEDSKEKISEKVTKEAVDKIVVYGSASSGSSGGNSGGKYEVSRETYMDCDGSGHGYYEIHYSDGSVDYVTF